MSAKEDHPHGRKNAIDEQAEQVMSDSQYLLNLAERIRHIPVMYGTDDHDIFRLGQIARKIAK